ncbi:MAG: DUF190 domain-containing protein [Candidatus Sumerlaeota bacterium]|nr:DUF190 domain-containing protein [Candidatus Sumerlaeota bacterium]
MIPYKIIQIYTSDETRSQGKSVPEAVMQFIRGLKIAARCLVTHSEAGCYENGEMAARRIEMLSLNMPVKIEIVLPAAECERILPELEKIVPDGVMGVLNLEVATHKIRKHLIPRQIKVRDVMTVSPQSVSPGAAVDGIIRLLLSSRFNAVPVVDAGNHPIGIITQGDLIQRAGMPVRLGLLEQFDHAEARDTIAALIQKKAGEIMTQPVTLVEEDKPLVDAVNIMLVKGLKRLPVVNANGVLTGMLARLDVFRTITNETPDWKAIGGKNISIGELRLVSDIMRRDAHTVAPEATVDEIIRIIDSNDIQRVAVVDAEGRLLGLISDKDLLNAFSGHKAGFWDLLVSQLSFTETGRRHKELIEQSRKTTAAQVMKSGLVTVREETTIDEAIRLMTSQGLKRLPVLDADGKFKGLISRDSLLRAGL